MRPRRAGSSEKPEKRRAFRVAAGLIFHNGRYLITKRKATAHLGGLWEFPGGKLEPRESPEACLRRELREELGIEITTPKLYQVVAHAYADHTVELHFFRCTIASGEAKSLDCDGLRWASPRELTMLEFPPADRSLIAALQGDAVPR